MAKRAGPSTSSPRAIKKAAKEGSRAKEVASFKRLDTLPQELWEKILDELDGNDLFPLALSCRYFRQKQKELVARTRQNGRESGNHGLALKTTLCEWPRKSQPASSDYVRFCSKEVVRLAEKNDGRRKALLLGRLAAFHGHLPLLQQLLKPLKTLDPGITGHAARGGQLETLQWLKTQKDFYLSEWLFGNACRSGHLEVLKWLRSEGCPWTEEACYRAAQGGHLEVLKWLRSEGCPWNEEACSCAAACGHLETLKWLRSEGCPWNEYACMRAAQEGHLDVLKWLRSEDCPWDEWACAYAAEGGHWETLRWLRSEGCPWDERTCQETATQGRLDVLKYLHENGCPWDEGTCSAAASNGHLEMLKYARENGCPWDGRTWQNAAESTREWLKDNGCPTDSEEWSHSSDEYSFEYSDSDEYSADE